MSTGRSPPASMDRVMDSRPAQKKVKTETEVKAEDATDSVLVNGVDPLLVARLPREALLDIILQTLPTSTALKAIVLDKLVTERLLNEEEIQDEVDADATDIESLSGDEAESSQLSLGAEETGPLAGLSVLSKLIMEIMNSAPPPEGGMPWREFEGIWPPVMGTVEDAIKECMGRGLLETVNGNADFVVSTMPMVETVLEE